MKRFGIFLVIMPLVVATVAGCWFAAAGAAGAGGVYYAGGKASSYYNAPVARAHDAMIATLRQENVNLYLDQSGPAMAKIEGTLPDGKKLKVSIVNKGVDVSQVSLRIGFWGDRDRSTYFLTKFNQQMGVR